MGIKWLLVRDLPPVGGRVVHLLRDGPVIFGLLARWNLLHWMQIRVGVEAF